MGRHGYAKYRRQAPCGFSRTGGNRRPAAQLRWRVLFIKRTATTFFPLDSIGPAEIIIERHQAGLAARRIGPQRSMTAAARLRDYTKHWDYLPFRCVPHFAESARRWPTTSPMVTPADDLPVNFLIAETAKVAGKSIPSFRPLGETETSEHPEALATGERALRKETSAAVAEKKTARFLLVGPPKIPY